MVEETLKSWHHLLEAGSFSRIEWTISAPFPSKVKVKEMNPYKQFYL